MTQMTEEEILRLAQKRVHARRAFWTHLSVYGVVNAFLIILWAVTTRGYPWFIWPLLGWGLGLTFNALAVFVWNRGIENRDAIEKEAAKIRGGK
jgi:hypothetical protein